MRQPNTYNLCLNAYLKRLPTKPPLKPPLKKKWNPKAKIKKIKSLYQKKKTKQKINISDRALNLCNQKLTLIKIDNEEVLTLTTIRQKFQ